jgi:hypothetical protein
MATRKTVAQPAPTPPASCRLDDRVIVTFEVAKRDDEDPDRIVEVKGSEISKLLDWYFQIFPNAELELFFDREHAAADLLAMGEICAGLAGAKDEISPRAIGLVALELQSIAARISAIAPDNTVVRFEPSKQAVPK